MPRTAIPLTAYVLNQHANEVAGTAIDQANGMYIDCTGLAGRLLITVNNTVAGIQTCTVRAGATNPPAFRSSLGDLVHSCQASARSDIGPLESARFIHAAVETDGGTGGRLFVDFQAGTTGTIWAKALPVG